MKKNTETKQFSLDMNIFYNIIEEDLEQFDFEEAHDIMLKLDHKWTSTTDMDNNPRTPEVSEIIRHVRKRIIEGYEYLVKNNTDYYATSTGGFRIENRHNEEDGYWTVIMYCPVESIW